MIVANALPAAEQVEISPDGQMIAVFNEPIRPSRRDLERQYKRHRIWSMQLRVIKPMDQHPGIGKRLRNDRMIRDVIEMAVCQPQANQIPPSLLCLIEQWPNGIVRRIKKHRLLLNLVGNEIGARRGNAAVVG